MKFDDQNLDKFELKSKIKWKQIHRDFYKQKNILI